MKRICHRYSLILLWSVLFTLLFFCLAIEYLWLFPLLAAIIGYGYYRQIEYFDRHRERMLAVGFVAAAVVAFFISNRDYMLGASAILVAFYLALFYRDQRIREQYTSLLPLIGLMMIATFLTDELFYLFFFLGFAFLYSYLLFYAYLNHFRGKIVVSQPLSYSGGQDPLLQKAKNCSGKLLLYSGILVFIALFFIAAPRTDWQLQVMRNLNEKEAAGFSKKIESRTVSQMLTRHNLYFRVRTKQRDRYFTGSVYNHYTGNNWEIHLPARKIKRNRHNLFLLLNNYEYLLRRRVTKANYFIDNYQGTIVFYRNSPKMFFFLPKRLTGDELIVDRAGNIEISKPLRRRIRYTVWQMPRQMPKDPKEEKRWARENFLALPPLEPSVKQLATLLTRGAKTPMQKARSIEQRLISGFSYNLGANPDKEEWVSYFARKRQGYCIHFATVMVVVLRLNGIPARLVGGFLGRTYYEGRFWISNEDAHAWVEAYFPGKGWLRFDPTPPQDDYLQGLNFWQRMVYHIRAWWFKNIINFSRFHQINIYHYLRRQLSKLLSYSHYLISGCLLVAFGWLCRRWRHRRRKQRLSRWRWHPFADIFRDKSRRPADAFAGNSFYHTMLTVIGQLKLERKLNETPYEFARRIQHFYPQISASVQQITRWFCQVRFGHYALTSSECRQVELILQQLAGDVRVISQAQNSIPK